MSDIRFFPSPAPLRLDALAAATGAKLADPSHAERTVRAIAPLEAASDGDLTFLDNNAYAKFAGVTRASACFITPKNLDRLAPGCAALVTPQPYRAFAKAAAMLFPAAARPQSVFGATGVSPGSHIHPEARLEPGVIVDPGAVIGKGAEIGRGTLIGAYAVIGPDVKIGRDCAIGAHVSIVHALIGNRVIVHNGARIGQDGFGFAMGPGGHLKVPQTGRVILQDDVDVGANSAIDRGANRDTVVGEGTKIDNLVQIGHNVTIGRHCVICGQVGIAGSSVLEDYVVLAGQVGLAGHLTIGMAAQVGAQSGVMNDIPAGIKAFGSPAKPARQVMREIATLERMVQKGPADRAEVKPGGEAEG